MNRPITALLLCLAALARLAVELLLLPGRLMVALVLLLAALSAGAQTQATYGANQFSYSGTASALSIAPANVMALNEIYVTQNSGINVTDGYIYLGSGGTAGDKVDMILVQATSWDQMAATAQCHQTFTETTGTINAWTHFAFTGCTLTQGYWFIAANTNDNGIGISFWTCYGPGSMANTGSCINGNGGANQSDTGELGAFYKTGVTYGTYTGLPTGAMNGTQNTTQNSMYILGTPIGSFPYGRLHTGQGFF